MADELPPDPSPLPQGDAVIDPDPSAELLLLPPTGGVMGPPPQFVAPPPPMLPRPTAQDPHERLMTLATLGAMLGMGTHGGTGAAYGLLGAQAAMDAHKQQQFKVALDLQQQQQQQVAMQQRAAEAIFARRQAGLQNVLVQFNRELKGVTSQDDYDQLITNYSSALQAAGYPRATADWFRAGFKWVPPKAEALLRRQVDLVTKSPFYKTVTDADPTAWQRMTVEVATDPQHPDVKTRFTLPQAMQNLGVDIGGANDDGSPRFVPLGKGTEEQNYIVEATGAFTSQFGHEPKTPADNTWIMDRVSKRKAEANALQRRPAASGAAPREPVAPGSREEKIAYDLAYGKLTFSQFRSLYAYSRDVNAKTAIYEKAGELNPKFNPASFEMGYTLAKTPRVQQQLASMSNVLRAVPDLLRVSNEATRAKSPMLNGYISRGRGFVIGDKRYSNLALARTAYADELSGALGFGSATDMSREMGFNLTDTSLSPEAFASGIQDIVVPFIERKRDTLLEQEGIYGQPGMNPAAPTPPTRPNYLSTDPNAAQPLRTPGGR